MTLAPGGYAGGQAPSETELKAAFLYKFIPFITWPADAFESDEAPIQVCVAGDDPFGSVLDRIVEGEFINKRPVQIIRVRGMRQRPACHVAYLAGSSTQSVEEMRDLTPGRPILTVTDSRNAPTKGIIHFVVRQNRLRFEIDEHEASVNRLQISSQLLNLAVAVKRRES